jgi:diguanylate cyclase (GGDEF)-like protein/PAS domain S-box-containing protein
MRALVFLGTSFAVAAAAAFHIHSGLERELVWLVSGLLCAGAVLLGARLNDLHARTGWRLVAVATGLFGAAAGIELVYRATGRTAGFPSLVDAASLAGCGSLGVGMLAIVRGRDERRDRAMLIDALALTTATAAIAWATLVEPHASQAGENVLKAAAVGWAFICLALLALAVCTTALEGTVTVSSVLLSCGATLQLSTMLLVSLDAGSDPMARPGVVALLRLASLGMVAAAALHPSSAHPGREDIGSDTRFRQRRLPALVGVALVPAGALAFDAVESGHTAMLVTVGATAALVLLVVLRVSDVLVRQVGAVEREHVIGVGAAKLAAARSYEEIEQVATATARGLVGDDAWVVIGSKVLPTRAADGRRFSIMAGDNQLGEIAVATRQRLSVETLHALKQLASHVALAIEGVKAVEQQATGRSEARFRSLVQNSSDLIAVLDARGAFSYIAPSVRAVLGHEPADLLGAPFVGLLHEEERVAVQTALAAEMRSTGTCTLELRMRRKDGSWCRLETVVNNLLGDPSVNGLVLTGHDVTQRRELEEQLAHQAFHDPLTSLANRALFLDRVTHALERSKRTFARVGVLFVDLDDFKTVNDSLGHAAGDELLVGVGLRLREAVRDADAVARLGGDEFAVLLEDVDAGSAEAVASRLLASLEAPVVVEGTELFPRASIGIALGAPGTLASSLLREADAAMYDAKSAGKSRYSTFRPELHQAANEALALKADLIRALSADELEVRYQPIVELESGRVAAFEALTRWQHAERGAVSPAEFIPLAEETGVIVDLGRMVLRRACVTLAELRRSIPAAGELRVTVNVSGRQLHGTSIVEDVRSALRESGIEPAALTLELTESTLVRDVDDSVSRLRELKDLGVRLAIDDFGTGFSSLAYLQRFPVDVLKIAREFVQEMGSDDGKARVASAVLRLGSTLSLDVVAEGIETPAQRDQLLGLGCGYGQGFLFAKPLSMSELAETLGDSARVTAASA